MGVALTASESACAALIEALEARAPAAAGHYNAQMVPGADGKDRARIELEHERVPVLVAMLAEGMPLELARYIALTLEHGHVLIALARAGLEAARGGELGDNTGRCRVCNSTNLVFSKVLVSPGRTLARARCLDCGETLAQLCGDGERRGTAG